MRWFIVITFLSILLSCKQSETTTNIVSTSSIENPSEAPAVKESIFLTMERTPCLGRCPNYKITIMNTGKVIYNGIKFTKKEGHFTKMLSVNQLSEIQTKIEEINLFEMDSKYDSNVTDIAAVALYVVHKGSKKKIFNRYGGPKELKEFENLIDLIVIDSQLVEIRD